MSIPFILSPGEQHAGAPPTGPRRPFIRIASGHTDGLLALGEVYPPPLTAGPNLHVHTNKEELFFVLDGVLTVQISDELRDIAAGGLAWRARGHPNAFANRAKAPARIMIQWIPGGVERLFEEIEEYRQTVTGSPESTSPRKRSVRRVFMARP